MRCQRIGREPMFTMGLGILSEYSRRRIPSPPQNSTTFMSLSFGDGKIESGGSNFNSSAQKFFCLKHPRPTLGPAAAGRRERHLLAFEVRDNQQIVASPSRLPSNPDRARH